jgi:acyl carrier protein
VPERAQLLTELGDLLVKCLKLLEPNPPISPNERIFAGRLGLDSVDAAQWAATVEQHYSVEIPDSALVAGALDSLGKMADILIRQGVRASTFVNSEAAGIRP